ncbi:MAG: hypothetical protein QF632_02175 [Candidatus Woesearchaeota archaeon]|jgi:hypothetical protein|nr:hypothetical protein [Candidatus Woesearchaeota archaeon]MDP7458022.1 hypothetical protein [Candidatus Woesearchaeota archaeon]
MIKPIHLKEAWRIFKHHLKVKRKGFTQYQGSPEEICKQVVDDSFNKEKQYYQVSAGHFVEFYSRDFGWCTESLLELGEKDKVRSTLDYALSTFQKHNKITTTINPKGIPFDFSKFAVDSLAYIIHSLTLLNDKSLINQYKEFLNTQIASYFKRVVDPTTGLVKKVPFSSMKDHSQRKSSCYDNCMIARLQTQLQKLNLNNPFKPYNYKKIILDNFWNDSFFLDDLSGQTHIAGDANLFPFYNKVITNKNIMKKAFNAIHEEKLDQPFPLKYSSNYVNQDFIFAQKLVPEYETTTIWMHMGPLYVKLLKSLDKERYLRHKQTYWNLVEKHKNFLEVYNPAGKPYQTWCYSTDESMSWAANLLTL